VPTPRLPMVLPTLYPLESRETLYTTRDHRSTLKEHK
jgi:hypothetical protein